MTRGDPGVRPRAFPVAEKFIGETGDFCRIEIADNGEFAVARSEQVLVAGADFLQPDILYPFDTLLDAGVVQPVLGRVGVQVPPQLKARERIGFAALRLNACDRRPAKLLEFRLGKNRLAQYFCDQSQSLGKTVPNGLD